MRYLLLITCLLLGCAQLSTPAAAQGWGGETGPLGSGAVYRLLSAGVRGAGVRSTGAQGAGVRGAGMRGAEIKTVGAQGAAASARKAPGVSSGYGEAGAGGRAGKAGEARWLWPTAPPHRVVRGFSAPTHRYGPGHRGIDISSPGPEVYAVQEGTVRFAGMVAGRPVVSVLHAGGLLSTYEPVVSDLRAGDPVRAGQFLGTVQPGHCAAAHCLHLGARLGRDEYIDPLLLLRGWRPIVLKPLGAGVGLGEGGA